MGILEVASGNSVWRGYDYFEEKKVISFEKISKTLFKGVVSGSSNEIYDVTLDVAHPKRSSCTCPHAEGTRRICKHKIALYFTIFPDEAERLINEARAYEEEEEQRQIQTEKDLVTYVRKLKKSEAQELLLDLLFAGPDWQYENFIRMHLDDYYNNY